MANYAIITNDTPFATEVSEELRAALEATPLLDHPEPIVFAVGGDGTFLTAIRQHLLADALFVGISAGTLGFLQSIQREQISDIIAALNTKSFSLLEAPLLTATYQGSTDHLGFAFNDITVDRGSAQAIKFDLAIDKSTGSFIGDGVIFSTPLGSTAYSLAAGGPIIDSKIRDCFVITPSNPHFSTLYSSLQRPHVTHRSRRVDIILDAADSQKRPARLMIDGHTILETITQNITISLSKNHVKIVQLNPDDFHSRIESKRLGRN